MHGWTRDVLGVMSLTFIGATAALVDVVPLPIRAFGVLVAAAPAVVYVWTVAGMAGSHLTYVLRSGAGIVLYVGVTGPRSDGPASLHERIAEHTEDAEFRAWKHRIEPANCTVTRHHLTRRGALISERRRIRALSAAARWNLCAPILNDVHNGRRVSPLLAVAWYALEGRINPDAAWHRPVVFVRSNRQPGPEPEPARRPPVSVPGDDEAGFLADVADGVRGRAWHPAGTGAGMTDAAVDETFAALTADWDADDTSAGGDVPPDSAVDSAGQAASGDVVPFEVGGTVEFDGGGTAERPQTPDGDRDASRNGAEAPENGASPPPDAGRAPTGASGGEKRSKGRRAPERVCVENGCRLAVFRYGRCVEHARAWDRERKQRKKLEDDGGDQ